MSRLAELTIRIKSREPNEEWLNHELPKKHALQKAVYLFFDALNQKTAWKVYSNAAIFTGIDQEKMCAINREIIRATKVQEDVDLVVKTICILFPVAIKSYVKRTLPDSGKSSDTWLASQWEWFNNRLELLWNFTLSFPAEMGLIQSHFNHYCREEAITVVEPVLDEDDLLTPDSATAIANGLLKLACRNTIPAIATIFARFIEKYESLSEDEKYAVDEWKFILDKMIYHFVFKDETTLAVSRESATCRFFGIFNSFSKNEFQQDYQCSLVHIVFFNYQGDFFRNILLVLDNTYDNLSRILKCLEIRSWLNVRGDYRARFNDAALSLFDERDLKKGTMTLIRRTPEKTKKIGAEDSSTPISIMSGAL